MTPAAFVPTPPVFDAIAAFGIGGLAVLMAVVVVRLRVRYQGVSAWSTVSVLGTWMLVMAGTALAGVFARFDVVPPPMAVMFPVIFGLPVVLAFLPFGGRLADALPVATLVGLQMFRLPLELLMHRAALLAIMPEELSYTRYNLDILTGAGAVVLVLWMRRRPVPAAVVWAWNLFGLACLGVIAWIAGNAAPMVRGFGDDPRHLNTWVLYFPYVWLPTVLVMIALTGHLVLTRKLWRRA